MPELPEYFTEMPDGRSVHFPAGNDPVNMAAAPSVPKAQGGAPKRSLAATLAGLALAALLVVGGFFLINGSTGDNVQGQLQAFVDSTAPKAAAYLVSRDPKLSQELSASIEALQKATKCEWNGGTSLRGKTEAETTAKAQELVKAALTRLPASIRDEYRVAFTVVPDPKSGFVAIIAAIHCAPAASQTPGFGIGS